MTKAIPVPFQQRQKGSRIIRVRLEQQEDQVDQPADAEKPSRKQIQQAQQNSALVELVDSQRAEE